jgi:hypothetical protein
MINTATLIVSKATVKLLLKIVVGHLPLWSNAMRHHDIYMTCLMRLSEAIENNDLDAIRDYLEEINTLREWLTLDDFNRSQANHDSSNTHNMGLT